MNILDILDLNDILGNLVDDIGYRKVTYIKNAIIAVGSFLVGIILTVIYFAYLCSISKVDTENKYGFKDSGINMILTKNKKGKKRIIFPAGIPTFREMVLNLFIISNHILFLKWDGSIATKNKKKSRWALWTSITLSSIIIAASIQLISTVTDPGKILEPGWYGKAMEWHENKIESLKEKNEKLKEKNDELKDDTKKIEEILSKEKD